jgi:hypothetical protein
MLPIFQKHLWIRLDIANPDGTGAPGYSESRRSGNEGEGCKVEVFR